MLRKLIARLTFFWPVVVIAVVLVLAAFELSRRSVESSLLAEAQAAAQARVQTLESILSVQRAVALTLADDGLARQALQQPDGPLPMAVSRKLERLHHETGSTIIYLIGLDGITISSSNWQDPISFVGGDYSFRGYFQQALVHGEALEYALGKDSFQPGLYLSHRITDGDRPLGVIVVKMQFDAMEKGWGRSVDLSYVTQPNGQVVLASDQSLRFQSAPKAGGKLVVSEAVGGTNGWRLYLHSSAAPAVQAGVIGAIVMLGLCGGVLTLRRRRLRLLELRAQAARDALLYQRDLEAAVEDRTRALQAEVEERRAAEERLAKMQGDLVQANKLATLGQVTAGLAHEVNQPLATIRLLADNGRMLLDHDLGEVRLNLERIAGMTDRIDRITTQLRGFARKATGELGAVSVREAIAASIMLTASRRRVRGAKLVVIGDDPDLCVHAEAVRLEQVLVNLIQNAQEALHDTKDPRITVRVSTLGDQVSFEISDNGPGIAPEMEGQVFMPFATSKSQGLGLGLVIARDIARDLGGELTLADPQPNLGACFILRLNRA